MSLESENFAGNNGQRTSGISGVCQGENFTFALEILDQLIDALSDENESES